MEALSVAKGYLLKLGRIAAGTDKSQAGGSSAASGAAPAAGGGTGASPPQLTGQQLTWTAKLVPGGSLGFKGFVQKNLQSCLDAGQLPELGSGRCPVLHRARCGPPNLRRGRAI